MNERRGDLEAVLAGLAPPEPPSDLQARVLASAWNALAREAGRDAWTRIWESRPLRLAWATGVLVLLVCHAGLSQLQSGRAASAPHMAVPARDGRGELAAIGRLPRLDESARPLIGVQAYRLFEQQDAGRTSPASVTGKESSS